MLRISFINVGYGDSIFVEELSGGRRTFSILVDGGNPYDRQYKSEYDGHPGRTSPLQYLMSHGVEKLDVVVLSHFHIDHIGGLPGILRNLAFGEVWSNYLLPEHPSAMKAEKGLSYRSESENMLRSLDLMAELSEVAKSKGKGIREIRENEMGIALTPDLSVDRYAVSEELYSRMAGLVEGLHSGGAGEGESKLYLLDQIMNAACVTLRLSYRGKKVLLAADVPASHWDPLLDAGYSIHADIFKFPHHGHKDGISARLAAAVHPACVVFSVSEDNPFGCPDPAVFGYFGDETRFYATGLVQMPSPPAVAEISLSPTPRSAIVCEIADDSRISCRFEKA